jgi:proline iminopeptidase
LNHLKIKEAHFIGHSWGAMLAMSYATNHSSRVRSLVLIDPGPFKLNQAVFVRYANNQQARLSAMDTKLRDSALRKMQSASATQEDSARYFKWELLPMIYDRTQIDNLILKINKGGLNPAMGGLMIQSLERGGFDLTQKLSAYAKPVHIISGAQDPLAFISYELKIVQPKAELHWIDKAGHFPMYEQPEEFYSILDAVVR